MFTAERAPRSICILRLSALGDVTHVLPVVHALRQQWPGVPISWICGSLEHRLLQHVPGIEFIVYDKHGGFAAWRALKRQLSTRRFEVLLQMQIAGRANLASLCVRADIRVGWDKASSRDLHGLFVNHRISPAAGRHQVETFLAFAEAVGAPAAEPVWELPVTDEAIHWLMQHVDIATPTLVISACSSHAQRNWLAERYAAVADHAITALGMQVVLSGGPAEAEAQMAADIEQHMHQPVINLVGKDTLQQSLALLAHARVLITPDSGPAHIANALGTAVLGLYACTNPMRSGPYGSLDLTVNRFPDAAREFAGSSVEALRWGKKIEQPGVMELITVEEVIDHLERELAQV